MPNSFETIAFESHVEYNFLQTQFSRNSIFELPIWKADQNKKCNEVIVKSDIDKIFDTKGGVDASVTVIVQPVYFPGASTL
jgi:hypothetical protein